ncbi:MAG: hypothetical protein JRF61_05370 [Deltaproteobacteria bacterium]|nr:hypothetical protein [Deltaproteobacteria bacterium]
MAKGRVESILFVLLLAVPLLAYLFVSNRTVGETPRDLVIPDFGAEFELPSVALPEPLFVFRRVARSESPRVGRPVVSDEMESALVKVRTQLLASSIPTEVHPAD